MGERFGLRWQVVLVGLLFLASLAVLLSSSLAAFQLPQYEAEMQKQLITASRRMAEAASQLLDTAEGRDRSKTPVEWHPRLARITAEALADLHGVEGGFYLRGEWTGYAFPNDPHARPEPSLPGKHVPGKKGKGKHATALETSSLAERRDPPPKERDFIYAQCKASLNPLLDDTLIVQTTVIPPSRILVVTQGVGRQTPAEMATWVMTRLTRPENMAADLNRYLLSAILALAGIVVSLLLTVNLGRNLRRERQQREQLREELRRSEHLAALGRMLAGVAHEVRNPLAAIRSTVQLYQRLAPARDPSMLDPILQNVDRLNALVSRLLFFVRTGHDERRPIDLNAIVQETLTLLRAQAESQGVMIQTELTPELPPLFGSAQALQQVVLNLATNALQAMPDGGKLLCRTRRSESPSRVELWVADTGSGIAAEEVPHLFEPFHTTRPEGTGLGLALCREIVQQHGGQVKLDHLAGWGAVFRVTLPIKPTS
ncbi:MAG TPA: ATP-binding protein [Gemmataceae bacterium]|jgi:signal transduction histidine kinase